jgi:hypothetical protein
MEMKQFVYAVDRQTKSSAWNDPELGASMLCRVSDGYQGCDLWHEFSADEV